VSTTVSKHQNFVGGEWLDATGGRPYGRALNAARKLQFGIMAKLD
jgi:hypothetical protein